VGNLHLAPGQSLSLRGYSRDALKVLCVLIGLLEHDLFATTDRRRRVVYRSQRILWRWLGSFSVGSALATMASLEDSRGERRRMELAVAVGLERAHPIDCRFSLSPSPPYKPMGEHFSSASRLICRGLTALSPSFLWQPGLVPH